MRLSSAKPTKVTVNDPVVVDLPDDVLRCCLHCGFEWADEYEPGQVKIFTQTIRKQGYVISCQRGDIMTDTTYLFCLEKDLFSTERTKELRKEIEESTPRGMFMKIEPMLNELVDLSMERAFFAGKEQR